MMVVLIILFNPIMGVKMWMIQIIQFVTNVRTNASLVFFKQINNIAFNVIQGTLILIMNALNVTIHNAKFVIAFIVVKYVIIIWIL